MWLQKLCMADCGLASFLNIYTWTYIQAHIYPHCTQHKYKASSSNVMSRCLFTSMGRKDGLPTLPNVYVRTDLLGEMNIKTTYYLPVAFSKMEATILHARKLVGKSRLKLCPSKQLSSQKMRTHEGITSEAEEFWAESKIWKLSISYQLLLSIVSYNPEICIY